MRMITETVDEFVAETDDAILVLYDDEEIWLPKSQIDYGSHEVGDVDFDIEVAEWLAIEKGII